MRDDRIKKTEAIAAAGKQAFAIKYEVTHTTTQVDERLVVVVVVVVVW